MAALKACKTHSELFCWDAGEAEPSLKEVVGIHLKAFHLSRFTGVQP